MAPGPDGGSALAAAVRRYEAIDDLMGRLGSYAGLVHAGDTVDPARTKFYGDMQERMTAASTHLLFFTLELNRIDDAVLDAAMADPALGHYRPWLEDVRRYRPYQLEDRVEQLFHEKSVTGYRPGTGNSMPPSPSCVSRLLGKSLAIEPTLNLMQDRSGSKRKAAAQALAKTFAENVQDFALITNTLAKDKEISDRWRGFADIADARHLDNRVEREVVDALVAAVRAAYPRLSHRYYALKAQMVRQEEIAALGSQRAAADRRAAHRGLDRSDGHGAHRLRRVLAENGGDRRGVFCQALDRRAGAAGQGAGRVCASDHALGASLCAAQLPGQAARRDDAGA